MKARAEANKYSDRSSFLTDLTAKELKERQLYLAPKGKIGYALDTEGDLQNVFKNKSIASPGAGEAAVVDAIKNGATTLDAFDGFLPSYYSRFGFVETGRQKFNDEYAPKGWNFERDGRPDVVFMAYQGGNRETIKDRYKTFKSYSEQTQGRYYDDWDTAKADSRTKVVDG